MSDTKKRSPFGKAIVASTHAWGHSLPVYKDKNAKNKGCVAIKTS